MRICSSLLLYWRCPSRWWRTRSPASPPVSSFSCRRSRRISRRPARLRSELEPAKQRDRSLAAECVFVLHSFFIGGARAGGGELVLQLLLRFLLFLVVVLVALHGARRGSGLHLPRQSRLDAIRI